MISECGCAEVILGGDFNADKRSGDCEQRRRIKALR
jgi:hypothetical protein